MPQRRDNRRIEYEVFANRLIRTVTLPDGRTYTHRCSRKVYENVAYQVEEWSDRGATMEELAVAIDAPYSQVNVTLEFLKERGCVVTRWRRSYPASNCLYEDAMTEFTFLTEQGA